MEQEAFKLVKLSCTIFTEVVKVVRAQLESNRHSIVMTDTCLLETTAEASEGHWETGSLSSLSIEVFVPPLPISTKVTNCSSTK